MYWICGPVLATHLRSAFFRPIVAADVLREAVQAHRIRQRLDHAQAVDATSDLQRQAGPAVLVDQCQDAQAPPVVRPGLYKVEAPDVVATERPQPHAGALIQPEAAARFVSPW